MSPEISNFVVGIEAHGVPVAGKAPATRRIIVATAASEDTDV